MEKDITEISPYAALHGLVQECLTLLQQPGLTKQEIVDGIQPGIVVTIRALGITPQHIQELYIQGYGERKA